MGDAGNFLAETTGESLNGHICVGGLSSVEQLEEGKTQKLLGQKKSCDEKNPNYLLSLATGGQRVLES